LQDAKAALSKLQADHARLRSSVDAAELTRLRERESEDGRRMGLAKSLAAIVFEGHRAYQAQKKKEASLLADLAAFGKAKQQEKSERREVSKRAPCLVAQPFGCCHARANRSAALAIRCDPSPFAVSPRHSL
jgi:hypothetical protein